MKQVSRLVTLLVIIMTFGCHKDSPIQETKQHSSFDIGNIHYTSNSTLAYETKFGQIIKLDGKNFELDIVLSDSVNKAFSITDTLKGADLAKARCILRLNNDFSFSSAGTVEYNKDAKTGSFLINIAGSNIKNGIIVVDSVINHSLIDFTSLSENDVNGWPITQLDTNDWGIRTNWELAERLIFNQSTLTTLGGLSQLIEYPNPFVTIFRLELDIPLGSKMDFYLVNQNLEIEERFIGLLRGSTMIQLINSSYKGNYYRLYYRLYSDIQQCYGSGDIKEME